MRLKIYILDKYLFFSDHCTKCGFFEVYLPHLTNKEKL